MDINHLRGWAEFMDRALVVSIIVAVLAVAAVGVSAWYSVRFAGAIRAQENAAFDRYKSEWGQHASQLEASVTEARDRITQLERTATDADERAAQAGREQAKASERAAVSEKEAAQARQRVAELEKAVEQASAQPAERETPKEAAEPKAPAAEPKAPAAEPSNAEPRNKQVVAELAKFAGAKAAIYIVDEAPDAAGAGSNINAMLTEAGWTSATWQWAGVGGILGVVVLIRQGSDQATEDAAAGIVEALRAGGFNAAKGHWPADWRRFRGVLNGPQTPGPTDAPIRIVVGAKAQ